MMMKYSYKIICIFALPYSIAHAEPVTSEDKLKGSIYQALAKCFLIDSKYAKYGKTKPVSAFYYNSEINTEVKAASMAIQLSDQASDFQYPIWSKKYPTYQGLSKNEFKSIRYSEIVESVNYMAKNAYARQKAVQPYVAEFDEFSSVTYSLIFSNGHCEELMGLYRLLKK